MSKQTELILTTLKALVEAPEFVEKFARLKELQVNPFKYKQDGSPQGWSDVVEANEIIHEILDKAIKVAEKVCADAGVAASGGDKLEAVVQFLDDVIALPFYLEPFDGMAIRFCVSQIVALLNKVFGKDWLNHIPVPTNATT